MSARCHECGRKTGPDWFLVCLRPPKSGREENVEEWLCGRPRCYAAYNEEADVVKGEVLETVGGIEVRRKVRDTGKLQPGQYVRNGRSVVLVESVNDAGARVRGVSGRGTGTVTTWSASAAGHTFLTKEEVEVEARRAAEERAASQDEAACENCWPTFQPGEDVQDKDRMGRDPHCTDHVAPEVAVDAARATVGSRKRGASETPEDVARVLALRASGMKFGDIEKAMGWPDRHGNRPWKICKSAPVGGPDGSKKSEPVMAKKVRRKRA
jgi:hypothetical protein